MRIFPFRGWRPRSDAAAQLIAYPYDVLNRGEAKEILAKNPNNFLKVTRSEALLADQIDPYDPQVYQSARKNLQELKDSQILQRDANPCFYVYRQIMGNHQQTGLVTTCHIDDYIDNLILKHELTRQDKETDRTTHITTTGHNTGPVFLFHNERENQMDALINEIISHLTPTYKISTDDEITHIFWVIDDPAAMALIQEKASVIPKFYIADGHHRAASSVNAGLYFKSQPSYTQNAVDAEHFLTIIFPANQLKILDYNRIVKDLNSYSESDFVEKIKENFSVSEFDQSNGSKKAPQQPHEISMFLANKWYQLRAREDRIDETDSLQRLDVNLLYQYILSPILGIGDPRTDKRIDFVGGIRGIDELERLVLNGKAAVAFAMYPTSIDDLIRVADQGKIMPPKSTWFEPKLRSGLILHQMSD